MSSPTIYSIGKQSKLLEDRENRLDEWLMRKHEKEAEVLQLIF